MGAFDNDLGDKKSLKGVYTLPIWASCHYLDMMTDNGTTQSANFNKRECRPYTNTSSTAVCIGLAARRVTTKPTDADDIILKPEWMNRELAIFTEGVFRLKNGQTGYTAKPGDKVSPYFSGFVQYTSGKAILGIVGETIPAGMYGLVRLTTGEVQ